MIKENLESKSYCSWETYLEEHPELNDIPSAMILQTYEEEITRFIIGLFK